MALWKSTIFQGYSQNSKDRHCFHISEQQQQQQQQQHAFSQSPNTFRSAGPDSPKSVLLAAHSSCLPWQLYRHQLSSNCNPIAGNNHYHLNDPNRLLHMLFFQVGAPKVLAFLASTRGLSECQVSCNNSALSSNDVVLRRIMYNISNMYIHMNKNKYAT